MDIEFSMHQYMKIEVKRLIHTLPGLVLSTAVAVLLALLLFALAEKFLPKALEIKPFRVGLCVEGSDSISDYVKDYILQMESTENLLEFCEMSDRDMEEALQEGELTAGIIIPKRTAESIMDGTNIPIRVLFGTGTDTAEHYLQREVLAALTECGAVMIDVPQAETLLLYEIQLEDPGETGVVLDLFHLGLVAGRAGWFEKEMISAFGSMDGKTYYMAAGMTLLFLFWGLGSGSFFQEQDRNLPLLLERKGISLFFQLRVREFLFLGVYLLPIFVLLPQISRGRTVIMLLLCILMLTLQCSFFSQLAPGTGSGIILNGVWGLAGFFGAGGMLPTVFLPDNLVKIGNVLPVGICMKLFRQIVSDGRGVGDQTMHLCIWWCLFFGAGSQLLFYRRQWSKKRK